MRFRIATALAAGSILFSFPILTACSLEAAMATCAQCGQVRSISPRELRSEIRLFTDAPQDAPQTLAIIDPAAARAPVVYDVRVRMDRGGSRDFVLSNAERLRVGDRVEIRDGLIVPLARITGHDWT